MLGFASYLDGSAIYRYEVNDSIDSSNFGKATKVYNNFRQKRSILIFLKKKELIISYDFSKDYSDEVLKAVFSASLPIDETIVIPDIYSVFTNYIDNAYIAKNKNPYLKCDTYIFQ